ncbi:hypothetical protein P0D88_23275 [Paraburkholderia sp. RL18-103-BIB-C]|uniref:hypothetical protein n=1 Tax=unclassified Paraburkholderia TaxID=2615204 RepID=UPI0038BB27CA
MRIAGGAAVASQAAWFALLARAAAFLEGAAAFAAVCFLSFSFVVVSFAFVFGFDSRFAGMSAS